MEKSTLIILYILSCIVCYFGLRLLFTKTYDKPKNYHVVLVFVPVVNTIAGALLYISYWIANFNTKLTIDFFNIKKKN